ncbi:MAG: polysaccharide pyruvyl transferase family protein, partial [Clostridiales bacterium]|nr:polysaccharide pyruvyl transferase family protein [Clostridiales bacterium]
MKTVIASMWFGSDYSDVIAAWALYKYLEKLGYEPVLLSKPLDLPGNGENLIARKFIGKHCTVLPILRNQDDYDNIVSEFDTFLSFGGRMWNYADTVDCGHYFYLDFVPDSKKKIAYGAGFAGKYTAPDDYWERARYYLSAFAGVSAASDADASVIKKKLGNKAAAVCGPEFLLKAEDYLSLVPGSVFGNNVLNADDSDTDNKKDFIAAMIRESDPLKTYILNETAAYAGVSVKEVGNVSVEEYIWYIANCKSVITDSYAAAVLALILNKPFAVLTSYLDLDNNRLIELLDEFGLSSVIVDKNIRYVGYKKILCEPPAPCQRINNYIKYISAK